MPNFQERIGASEQNQMPSQQRDEFLFMDLLSDAVELKHSESWQTQGIARKPLVRYPDFRITLMALKRGAHIEEHHNPGRISVHTLEGHITMRAAGQVFQLARGRLLVLDRAVRHDVEAVEDSVFLLTAAHPENRRAE